MDNALPNLLMRTGIAKDLQPPANIIMTTMIGRLISKIVGRRGGESASTSSSSGFLQKCAVKLLRIQPTDNVLQVGHGTGIGLRCAYWRVAEGSGQIFGIDNSEAMVQRATKFCALEIGENKVHVFRASVNHLPFPDKFFDKVFHSNSYYYWPSLDRANREIYRVMKPGSLMVTALYLDELKKQEESGALRSAFVTDPTEYMISLESAGFVNVKVKYYPFKDKLVYQGIFAEKPILPEPSDEEMEADLEKLKGEVVEEVRAQMIRQLQRPLDMSVLDKRGRSDPASDPDKTSVSSSTKNSDRKLGSRHTKNE